MKNTQTTLSRFFPLEQLSQDRLSEITESKEFSSIKAKIARELKGVPVPASLFELMLKQVHDLLDIDLATILARAWSQHRALQDYLDQKKYPPGESVLVPLLEHTIISEHAPSLEPTINDLPLGEITFNVNLELKLQGAVLKIQDGKIKQFSIGSCQGKGSVKYAEFPILEQESSEWPLGGTIDLGDGVAIPPLHAA
ncbi:MAG: hypothetical protein ACE5HO_14475 [bacterium]